MWLWRWLAQVHFITQENKTTRSSPQFAEAAQRGRGGSSPCMWAPGLALYNT